MNSKPSKARGRFKDKCMIYFKNKEIFLSAMAFKIDTIVP